MYELARIGDLERIRYLVETNGAAVNPKGRYALTPLHLDVVKYLIDKGATVNQKSMDGETPLHVAARQDHLDVVESLKIHGAASGSSYNGEMALNVITGMKDAEEVSTNSLILQTPDSKENKHALMSTIMTLLPDQQAS